MYADLSAWFCGATFLPVGRSAFIYRDRQTLDIMNNPKYLNNLLHFLYCIFFTSLACGLRPVTSISIVLLLLTNIAKNRIDTGSFINPHIKNNFFIACCIFYILQVSLIVISQNHSAMLRHIEIKASIVFVPLMVCCNNYLNPDIYQKLMKYFVWALAGTMLFFLLAALRKYYFLHSGTDVFYYHALVSPFKQHAILLSILIFIAFVYLLEASKKGMLIFNNRFVHFLLAFYFISCILLLSSKLVISFTLIAALYYLLLNFKKVKFRFAGFATLFASLALIIIVLTTSNRISKRFNEIIHTNLSLIKQKTFDPGIYFDGIQFRLLQWRFVKEILTEKNAWLTGVSDNAQPLLDEKYISTRMYIGNGTAANRGYLDYNTHNEFLESLLQSGIPGLICFTFICLFMIQLLIRRWSRELFFIVAILLAYSLNESLFQRQYSITIFTFFPLFAYFSTAKPVRNTI
jgi:O-antigen ligase